MSGRKATILGNEFAGSVEAVGGAVESFKVGDKVFGYSGTRFGAHAEYMSMPEDGTLAIIWSFHLRGGRSQYLRVSHYALSNT